MSANNAYAAALLASISYVSVTIDLITIIIGTIGGICNLITFTAPQLRRNACVFYLLCATAFQLLSILFIVPARTASNAFGSTLERQSIVFCKIRFYLVISLPQMATYSILLSIMDRCLAASNKATVRAWNDRKVAVRLTASMIIFVFVPNIHLIVFYTIYNNNCQTLPGTFPTFFAASYALTIGIILPHALMLILCVVTHLRIRSSRERVAPVSTIANPRPVHRFESQIIIVIVVQVVVSTLLLLLRVGSYAYSIFTSANLSKTLEERAVEGFVLQLGVSLYYFSFAIAFYVSTLTSKYFRDIFVGRIRYFYRRFCGQ